MRRFAAVALREIAERRFVLVAAAAAAVLPFLVPFLPGIPAGEGPVARSILALTLSAAFGLGGSLLVGASVVGRELAERRLSFHFSRPLAAPVVWGGKLAGGLALVLLAEAIVLGPSSLASGRFPGLWGGSGDTWAIWAVHLLAVPLFLLAWVGSVALRSRSPWLVVDLVLLVAVPALLFVVVRRLLRYGHPPKPTWALAALGILVAALLAATLAQVVTGRTDCRRGHGAQSLALWSILLAATAAGAAWAERVIDPGVARLARAWASTGGPSGDWVFLEGSAEGDGSGSSTYLVNLATGRSLLLPVGEPGAVSADGTRAVRISAAPFGGREIVVQAIDLRSSGETTLDVAQWPDGLGLSADGRRLAVVVQGLCTVYELPSLRALASARVPSPDWAYAPLFVTPDRVRLHPRQSGRRGPRSEAPPSPGDPVAAELDVPRKAVTTLVAYPVSSIPASPGAKGQVDPGPTFLLLPSPDLSRVLVLGFGTAHAARLVDAASGRVLASVDGSQEAGRPIGYFLSDGRAVVSEPGPGDLRLALFAPDGSRAATIPLPAGTKHIRFGYEPAKGLLALGLGRDLTAEKRDWVLADLATGRLSALPVEGVWRTPWYGSNAVPVPGSPATRLAYEAGTWRLVLFDPATGAQTPVTRGRAGGK